MNVPVYIGFTILEVSKMVVWEFFYDYHKPKYGDKIKLCYTGTDSFILHIKAKDFYEDIDNDVEEWFDTSDYTINRPLLMTDKNKKVLGKLKDELKGRIMTKFIGLFSKAYAYLIDDFEEKKKKQRSKKICSKK